MSGRFSYKFFFERTFNPIALYKTDAAPSEADVSNIRYLDVNPAYERVNNVRREDVIGKTFLEVWPKVEPRWGDIVRNCLKMKAAVHCEGESRYTSKYLEAIAFPLSDDMAATIFLDRTELKKSEEQLRANEKKLLAYQTKLRELATELTLSEEKTRREIATDLHASIGHALLILLLELRKLREEYKLSADANCVLDNTIQMADRMITESRQLIFELSPPILREVGLTPALEALADNLLTPRGIKWRMTTRGEMKDYNAEDAVCVILYRTSRELLINVIKHSQAKNVEICVNRGGGKIQVVIDDDGVGMPKHFELSRLGRKTSGGLGLFSIRERLIHIGGDMQIVSAGVGTTVSLLAPLVIDRKPRPAKERGTAL